MNPELSVQEMNKELGTIKFYHKIYSIRFTGKIVRKKAKTFDYDGQDIVRPASRKKQMGVYLNDVLYFTINENGDMFQIDGGKKVSNQKIIWHTNDSPCTTAHR